MYVCHYVLIFRTPLALIHPGRRERRHTTHHAGLVLLALAFSFASGANDGVTLAATSARSRAMPPLAAIGLLAVAVGSVPLLLGTGVASTVAHGLVSFEHSDGQAVFVDAVASSLAVVLALSRRGLPTSLTMALTGAIVGAGIGAGLPTRWATIGAVLASGVAAPVLSLALAFVLARPVRLLLGAGSRRRRRARLAQRAAFLVQCVAYGANDAEKLPALLAIAAGPMAGGAVQASAGGQALLAVAFAAGALVFVRKTSARVAGQMARVGDDGTLSAVVAATATVLGGSGVRMPLSSTQATTSALLGSSARLEPWSVRWQEVRSIGVAWVTTLPSAFGLACLAGLLVRL